jgi:hypothetical protein
MHGVESGSFGLVVLLRDQFIILAPRINTYFLNVTYVQKMSWRYELVVLPVVYLHIFGHFRPEPQRA